MILYCYKCHDCGHQWEKWRNPKQTLIAMSCPDCKGLNTGRDYQSENKTVRGDIEPGFDRSLGIKYSGRKDRFSQYKAAGFGSMAHGGGIVPFDKTYYGEERYRKEVLHEGKVNQWYLEQLQKGVEMAEREGPGELQE